MEYSNLVKPNYAIPTKTASIYYDGRLLKETNVDIPDITCTFSFCMDLITEEGEVYTYKAIISPEFKSGEKTIYDGNFLQTLNVDNYVFYRVK